MRIAILLVALAHPTSALTATRELLELARSRPLYVSSSTQREELNRCVEQAVLEQAGVQPSWPRVAELLCDSPWELVATTNSAVAGPLLPRMDADPESLGSVAVTQRWSRENPTSQLRCDNVVTISRPSDTWTSAWTLLPVGGESSLTLEHTATVECAEAPLRLSIALDRVALDGNRRAGETPEEIVGVPVPRLPSLPPLPALPSAVADAGSFEVLVLNEECCVTRAVAAAQPTGRASDAPAPLRIFARRREGSKPGAVAATPAAAVRSRAGAPSMLAAGRKPPARSRAKQPAVRGRPSPSSSSPTKSTPGKIDANLAASIYYGLYTLFFGRLLLALFERFVAGSGSG